MECLEDVRARVVKADRHGVRVGKGAGYSDIEVALLVEAGLIGPQTTIVTTVHQLQVVDEDLPETGHDFSVDVIVTPDEVIPCEPDARTVAILLVNCGPAWFARALGSRLPHPAEPATGGHCEELLLS